MTTAQKAWAAVGGILVLALLGASLDEGARNRRVAEERYGDLWARDDRPAPARTVEKPEPAHVEVPAAPAWRGINFVDDFGKVTGRGAMSDPSGPVRPMSFPYSDVTARIYVNCDTAWLRFSKAPNLRGGAIQSGRTRYSVNVLVEGDGKTSKPRRWSVSQVWGGRDLYFAASTGAVASLSAGSEFAVALPWYGQDSAAFSWSLRGSSDAIRRSCD